MGGKKKGGGPAVFPWWLYIRSSAWKKIWIWQRATRMRLISKILLCLGQFHGTENLLFNKRSIGVFVVFHCGRWHDIRDNQRQSGSGRSAHSTALPMGLWTCLCSYGAEVSLFQFFLGPAWLSVESALWSHVCVVVVVEDPPQTTDPPTPRTPPHTHTMVGALGLCAD